MTSWARKIASLDLLKKSRNGGGNGGGGGSGRSKFAGDDSIAFVAGPASRPPLTISAPMPLMTAATAPEVAAVAATGATAAAIDVEETEEDVDEGVEDAVYDQSDNLARCVEFLYEHEFVRTLLCNGLIGC